MAPCPGASAHRSRPTQTSSLSHLDGGRRVPNKTRLLNAVPVAGRPPPGSSSGGSCRMRRSTVPPNGRPPESGPCGLQCPLQELGLLAGIVLVRDSVKRESHQPLRAVPGVYRLGFGIPRTIAWRARPVTGHVGFILSARLNVLPLLAIVFRIGRMSPVLLSTEIEEAASPLPSSANERDRWARPSAGDVMGLEYSNTCGKNSCGGGEPKETFSYRNPKLRSPFLIRHIAPHRLLL
ncbi:hypothetical protein AXG93_392s1280 [Marchantia polymorpha subsp. ruderalis]|uniref:Uncharacterized protein n=1 Tax=Marchantia polymorpha subsp. ruderalis TaxID=1480154 RepID=A0A176WQ83_MARPO|nr:hypothetical protein AXG93_392s1280 [Marchantia polymorpha subsp. ruderalis]